MNWRSQPGRWEGASSWNETRKLLLVDDEKECRGGSRGRYVVQLPERSRLTLLCPCLGRPLSRAVRPRSTRLSNLRLPSLREFRPSSSTHRPLLNFRWEFQETLATSDPLRVPSELSTERRESSSWVDRVRSYLPPPPRRVPSPLSSRFSWTDDALLACFLLAFSRLDQDWCQEDPHRPSPRR